MQAGWNNVCFIIIFADALWCLWVYFNEVIFIQVLLSSLTTGCPASVWKKRKEKSQSFWSTVPLYEPFTLKWYLLLLLRLHFLSSTTSSLFWTNTLYYIYLAFVQSDYNKCFQMQKEQVLDVIKTQKCNKPDKDSFVFFIHRFQQL